MQIDTIKVSNKEVEEAVTEWLQKHFGLTVQIESVSKRYTHLDGWEVELKTDDKGQVMPAASIVERILTPVGQVHVDSLERINKENADADEKAYIESLQPDAIRLPERAVEAP